MWLDPLDYGREEETDLSPSLRYKAESFLPVIDQFIASVDQRLQAYKLLAGQFVCFVCKVCKDHGPGNISTELFCTN